MLIVEPRKLPDRDGADVAIVGRHQDAPGQPVRGHPARGRPRPGPDAHRPVREVGQRPVRSPGRRLACERLPLGAAVGRDLDPAVLGLEEPADQRIRARVPTGAGAGDAPAVRREHEAALVPPRRLDRSRPGKLDRLQLTALVRVVEDSAELRLGWRRLRRFGGRGGRPLGARLGGRLGSGSSSERVEARRERDRRDDDHDEHRDAPPHTTRIRRGLVPRRSRRRARAAAGRTPA